MKDGFVKVAAVTPALKVADCAYNAGQIIQAAQTAASAGVKLLVTPELGITGYTCSDLFLQNTLLQAALAGLETICNATAPLDIGLWVGLPLQHDGKLYNCAAFLQGGRVLGLVPKSHLPTYAEFYERRQFTPAFAGQQVFTGGFLKEVPFSTQLLFSCSNLPGLVVAAEICEDLWVPAPPSIFHAGAGATIIVNLSASNETIGKAEYRRSLVGGQAARLVCGYIYADAGSGESTTDIVFCGHNLIAENGILLAETPLFSNQMAVSEIDMQRLLHERRRMSTYPASEKEGYRVVGFSLQETEAALTRPISPAPFIPGDAAVLDNRCETILAIQAAGLEKRLLHTGCKTLVLGVSGGLDSSLALLVAARALQNLGRPARDILAVTMPAFGTTARTRSNAELLAIAIGASFRCIDITATVRSHFADIAHSEDNRDVTYENAQARIRTLVLMDLANQQNGLVIGTGDLSELALGWATYNGDHMSMYAVNASVPKTLIRYIITYEASLKHTLQAVLQDILETPVSPELLPAVNGEISQQTEEIVGPYELHDFTLYYALRWGFSPGKILRLAEIAFAQKYSRETILKWLLVFYRRFFAQQFNRRCLPDGPKVGSVSLSPRGDWRMPSDASAAAWLNELEALQTL
ncbi:MAG: NAD(+) synthase [Oscillospiraceae bacterium]